MCPRQVCLMMEFCGGGDLFDRLEAERAKPGGVSERALLAWSAQIADAVAFIHSKVRGVCVCGVCVCARARLCVCVWVGRGGVAVARAEAMGMAGGGGRASRTAT